MGVVNMLGVFIFMLAGIIVGGFILIIEWIVAAFKDIDKWNPEVRDCRLIHTSLVVSLKSVPMRWSRSEKVRDIRRLA